MEHLVSGQLAQSASAKACKTGGLEAAAKNSPCPIAPLMYYNTLKAAYQYVVLHSDKLTNNIHHVIKIDELAH